MDTTDTGFSLAERMARSVMNRYTQDQVQWHYEHGLVLQSIYAVGTAVRNPEYQDWVQTMYDARIKPDGSIDSYKKDEFNLDQINPGKTLFDLYARTGDQKYRTAIEILREQLRNQPRTESGGFWHKKIYPWQMWLDGLYMQAPFYARYAAEFGTIDDFHDVLNQLVLVESKTRDPQTGLLYHAWDESRKQLWANPSTGCSPHFWGRAMGWYCMALVDVLDFVPADASLRSYCGQLNEIIGRLADVLAKFQDKKTGLWYQVLDQGKRDKNYLETSASSMFAYFLFKACRKGYVAGSLRESAMAAARKGFDGLRDLRLAEDENKNLRLSGICSVAGLGGNPYRDGSFDYYVKEPVVTDDFKGVGPFIFAALEASLIV